MDLTKFYIYDIETYKDLFSFSVVRADGEFKSTFQCSKFKNEIDRIYSCLNYLNNNDYYLVGFNSNQFDYPVLHEILKKRGRLPKSGISIANKVFDLAQKQIESFRGEGFGNTIKYEDQYVKQIDLFKVHHFDNRAKMTSLKMIEFNLRMSNLKDLPYEIESTLTEEMIAEILQYNEHDVEATRLFFIESMSQVQFRLDLTEKYGKSFLNHNDGKIGKDYFQMELENRKVKLREFKNGREVVKQTKRDKIVIGDCLFDYYDFTRPECNAIKDWFSKQVITETKGVFSNIEEHLLFGVAKYAATAAGEEATVFGPGDKALLRVGPGGCTAGQYGKIDSTDFNEVVAYTPGVTTAVFCICRFLETKIENDYAEVELILTNDSST